MRCVMRNILRITLIGVLALFLLYVSLLSLSSAQAIDQKLSVATLIATPNNAVVKEEVQSIDELPFKDNTTLYADDDPTSVVYMYVTVRKGDPADNTDHTWQQVTEATKWQGVTPLYGIVLPRAEAILQIGDENGPLPGEVGYGEVVPNATIQIRGNSTTVKPQKSYKIELRSRAGKWREQSTINLVKSFSDVIRCRNKLSFDLMKQIPNMVSLRTQYVRLFVKDETTDPPKIAYVDYGLYTQVEQTNRAYLRNHYLDPDGQLYKATFFEFLRYPDQIRLATDPLYDEQAFSRILEIKGNNDHTKLIQMLEDVNNVSIPIEQTFEKHFNAENYFTWLAFNILMGNLDTQSQNFLLYSPRNGNKWYFIPWDYDGDLGRQWQDQFFPYDKFEYGIANYWAVPLHNRVLKVARYRNMLDEKMTELLKFLSPDRLQGMLNEYKKVTDAYTLQMPDLYYLKGGVNNYEAIYAGLSDEIKVNYDLYRESLQTPMPFFLDTPEVLEKSLIFSWGESYDFNAQDITYKLEIARGWDFQDIIYTESLMNQPSTRIDMLASGTYFWRVIATNENGKTQYPFDVYIDSENVPHSGMRVLYISADGKVLEE